MEKTFFDQPLKSDLITYKNIRKFATGQGDDYATCCLLDYNYFKNDYKMIAIDLSKQQELGADPKAIQQIYFTGRLDRAGQTSERSERTNFRFFARSCESIVNLFCFNIISI